MNMIREPSLLLQCLALACLLATVYAGVEFVGVAMGVR